MAYSGVQTVQLNNGNQMPIVGLGTWNSFGKPAEQITQAVKDAIDAGYRLIDTAHAYGNEHEVGEAVNAKIAEGLIKREDIFITSKLWNTFHRADLVRGALETTIKQLNTPYLDLYLIHWPLAYKEGRPLGLLPTNAEGVIQISDADYLDTWKELEKAVEDILFLFPTSEEGEVQFSNVDFCDTWKELEKAVDDGLVKNIGVSNFNRAQLERLLAVARIPPVTNQIEVHPYLVQKKLSDFCASKNIAITAYSPLGAPARTWVKNDDPVLLDEPKLVALAAKYGKNVGQLLIRYQVQRGHIVIPKSANKKRIISNLDVFDFELSAEDVEQINAFDRNARFSPMDASKAHPDYPFHDEY